MTLDTAAPGSPERPGKSEISPSVEPTAEPAAADPSDADRSEAGPPAAEPADSERTAPADSERTESERETPTGSAWSRLRPLVLRTHFYAGLLIAPFILLAAVSGLLYALSFQAEKIVYRDELTVPAGQRYEGSLPLADQIAAARNVRPDGTVVAVRPATGERDTTRVLMDAPGVPEGSTLAVFVDPHTGKVRGELPSYGSSGALPLRTWLDELHRDLRLGEFGRNYSELAASWLWVVALGGLALWIGRRRSSRRDLLRPEPGAKGRRRTLSWHGTVGAWAVLGLVVLSATGLTWSRYAGENIGAVQDQLGGATPAVSATLDGGSGGGDGGHAGHGAGHGGAYQGADIGIDRALESARAAGIDGPLSITLPAAGTGYVIKETDTTFPVRLDSVAVDPADGAIVDELRFDDYPLLAKATRYGIDAHMGVLFGLANQLVLAALAVALILVILWGYRMWWQRRPTKGRALGGRPVPRGAWRKVPPVLLLPLAAAVALVGWFVPLLGLSLLVFLAVDLALGAVSRLRSRTAGG
ncbi:PepSY domain-containing protein [Streptomyces sp. NPDC020875]|uniref:PepSY-associated TM helix domain-containing protein n=1 Tax=Streptomyces sp. NPDC020875 TaxID=3154898 RepID=UPI0033EF26DD